MSKEIVPQLLNWLLPTLSTLLGFCIQSFISNYNTNKGKKQDYILKIYDKRISIYEEFYNDLIDYFNTFNKCNETDFNYREFDFTDGFDKLNKSHSYKQFYFSEQFNKRMENLKSEAQKLNSFYSSGYIPLTAEEFYKMYTSLILHIEWLMQFLRDEIGLTDLDTFINHQRIIKKHTKEFSKERRKFIQRYIKNKYRI